MGDRIVSHSREAPITAVAKEPSMSKLTVTVDVEAAHRLPDHQGRCSSYHGHHYVFEVCIKGQLNEQHMVVDFSKVKEIVREWLDVNFDHAMLLRRDDPIVEHLRTAGHRFYLFDYQPTAEVLARHVFDALIAKFSLVQGATLEHVLCWETPNCCAGAYRE